MCESPQACVIQRWSKVITEREQLLLQPAAGVIILRPHPTSFILRRHRHSSRSGCRHCAHDSTYVFGRSFSLVCIYVPCELALSDLKKAHIERVCDNAAWFSGGWRPDYNRAHNCTLESLVRARGLRNCQTPPTPFDRVQQKPLCKKFWHRGAQNYCCAKIMRNRSIYWRIVSAADNSFVLFVPRAHFWFAIVTWSCKD